jgi:radical SAM protein with 4Fe4S-binding SPASM domain
MWRRLKQGHRSGGAASVKTFLSLIENPILRSAISISSKPCPVCGRSHLESALDEYIGHTVGQSHPTGRLASWFVLLAIRLGSGAFNIEESMMKEALQTPYFRKGLLNVLNGIAQYGVTKPQRLAAPFLVVWNYTNACNLRCRHCYQNAEKPSADELSTEERLEVVDQLEKAHVSSIAFSGGEPLMRADFFQVAEHAARKGIYVSVATNGTLMTKQAVRKLKAAGVRYAEVSLDGATAETHDTFRGVPGSFGRTVEGIKNLVEEDVYTCIATTATKYNFYEVPSIVELAKMLHVKRVIVFNFIPTGRGQAILDMDLSPAQRERLLEYLYGELVKGDVEALCTAPQYARVCLQRSIADNRERLTPTHFVSADLHGQTRHLAEFIGGCGAGRMYCAIQPNGLVTPCVFMPITIGDLRKESLVSIWKRSDVLDDLSDRERLKGRCGRCQYRHICGGCRARAYAYYQDYLAPDPGCIRELEESSYQFARERKAAMEATLPIKT